MSGSLVGDLVALQNPDGGWGYGLGQSWTEPTSYAILALSKNPEHSARVAKAKRWLVARQRRDGGWAPDSTVDQSTWVTSLAVLALADTQGGPASRSAGLQWIVRQTSADAGLVERLRRRMIGVDAVNYAPPAWPWVPGTSSWVTPTAISMLSLEGCRTPGSPERVESGAQFLFRRQCADGGWNHGGTPARSDNAASYPETTGLALLSLRGRSGPAIERALARARELSRNPGSAAGLAWLRFGLRAHGEESSYAGPVPRCWTVVDTALTLLSASSGSPFL